jgi:hypothetical protein
MEPGENWAYRARAVDDLVEVKVLRLGTKKPPRVLVHFLDDHFEGREDWVPPARLKVIWSGVEEYVARERHWAAVSGAFPVADTAGEYAAGHVIEEYLDRELAGVQYGSAAGVCSIYDVAGLARFLDVDAAQLTSHPLAFSDGEALVVPWPITELIARRVAQRNPEPILRHVAKDETAYRYKLMHGEASPHSRNGHIEADFFAEHIDAPLSPALLAATPGLVRC